jgi:hypothetical protein
MAKHRVSILRVLARIMRVVNKDMFDGGPANYRETVFLSCVYFELERKDWGTTSVELLKESFH